MIQEDAKTFLLGYIKFLEDESTKDYNTIDEILIENNNLNKHTNSIIQFLSDNGYIQISHDCRGIFFSITKRGYQFIK